MIGSVALRPLKIVSKLMLTTLMKISLWNASRNYYTTHIYNHFYRIENIHIPQGKCKYKIHIYFSVGDFVTILGANCLSRSISRSRCSSF